MDRFYYEIIATPDGARHVPTVQGLITGHPLLAAGAEVWGRAAAPAQADLYALLVVASEGLAHDAAARARIAHVSGAGFPVIPVVEDRGTYDFSRAPLSELVERNAEGLNDPDRLLRSLLHHAGIELFEGGGHVFISYARADGSALAEAIRDGLTAAGIGRTMDVYAFAGGDLVQDDIERRIRSADLVVLVDSAGAARSAWVAEELDMAFVAHVQAIAVTPTVGAFHHAFQVPHVPWAAGSDVAVEVVRVARRVLARKLAFRARVERVLGRLARLRGWTWSEHGERWRVRPTKGRGLTISCIPDAPRVEDVTAMKDAIYPERGLLVAGVRPLQPLTERGLREAGGRGLAVTALPTMASKIPAGLARRPLAYKRVFLSGAMPSEPDELELARLTLGRFVVGLVQSLVELGATLVFGGHPSVTPLVHKAVAGPSRRGSGRIELHQAQVWRHDTASLPLQVREGPLFGSAQWHGAGLDPAADVGALRDGMIRPRLDAGVFVGGRTVGYFGPRPGIVDEHDRLRAACPDAKVFVVGIAGGASRSLARDATPLADVLATTADPDLAVALIIAELLGL